MRIITCSSIHKVTGRGTICVTQQFFNTGDHVLLDGVEHKVMGVEITKTLMHPQSVKPDRGYILREVNHEKENHNQDGQQDQGSSNS